MPKDSEEEWYTADTEKHGSLGNIRLTLLFIYIYKDVLPAFSLNEWWVYSAFVLSDYVKSLQLM